MPENANLRLAARGVHGVLTRQLAALVIVGADERLHLHTRIGRGLGIEAGVDDDDRDAGVPGFHERRNDLARPARGDHQYFDARLAKVFDNLHLLVDVHLALGGLHLQVDAKAIGRFLRAAPHIHEERVVERLEHQRHGRLVAGGRRGPVARERSERERENEKQRQSAHDVHTR